MLSPVPQLSVSTRYWLQNSSDCEHVTAPENLSFYYDNYLFIKLLHGH